MKEVLNKKNITLKLLFLITIFLSFHSFAYAVQYETDPYEFRIDNPAVGYLYFIIFNGIASLFNGASGGSGALGYISLLKLAFSVGGFVMFAIAVGKTMANGSHAGLVDFLKYLLIGTSLLYLMFGSKSTIIVKTDNLVESYCSNYSPGYSTGDGSTTIDTNTDYSGFTVGNVPTLLAWTFTTMNKIGYELTLMARTLFSGTDELSLTLASNSSTEYAHYLQGVNAILTTTISDMLDTNTTTFSSSDFKDILRNQALGPYFRQWMKDCIFMLNSTDADVGTKIQEAIESTSFFTKTLDAVFSNNNITIYDGKGNGTIIGTATLSSTGSEAKNKIFNISCGNGAYCSGTCGEFWSDIIKPSIESIDPEKLLCQPSLAGKIDKGTMYILTGEYNAPSASASQIAMNSGLFQMYGSMKNGGYVAEDISYASGKTKADFIMNNVGTGMYMAQMLPYLQMGIRAVLYAFFPFVFVVILLPGGVQVLISYLSTLLWVELWTPVAAVLNLFLGSISANKFQRAFNADGFNSASALNILSDSAMLASVGGYLYASVPALTWLVLKGSGQMLGSITGAMAGGYAANLASSNINKDMQALEKTKEVNDFSSSETGKFLSMAEIEQSQAVAQGQAEGAEFGQIMMASGGSLKGFENAHKFAGIKKGNDFLTTTVEGKGLTSFDAKATGAHSVEKTKANTIDMVATGMIDQNGNLNLDKVRERARVEGYDSTEKFLQSKRFQESYQKQLGLSKAEATKKIAKFKADNDIHGVETTKSTIDTLGGNPFISGQQTGHASGIGTRVKNKAVDILGGDDAYVSDAAESDALSAKRAATSLSRALGGAKKAGFDLGNMDAWNATERMEFQAYLKQHGVSAKDFGDAGGFDGVRKFVKNNMLDNDPNTSPENLGTIDGIKDKRDFQQIKRDAVAGTVDNSDKPEEITPEEALAQAEQELTPEIVKNKETIERGIDKNLDAFSRDNGNFIIPSDKDFVRQMAKDVASGKLTRKQAMQKLVENGDITSSETGSKKRAGAAFDRIVKKEKQLSQITPDKQKTAIKKRAQQILSDNKKARDDWEKRDDQQKKDIAAINENNGNMSPKQRKAIEKGILKGAEVGTVTKTENGRVVTYKVDKTGRIHFTKLDSGVDAKNVNLATDYLYRNKDSLGLTDRDIQGIAIGIATGKEVTSLLGSAGMAKGMITKTASTVKNILTPSTSNIAKNIPKKSPRPVTPRNRRPGTPRNRR